MCSGEKSAALTSENVAAQSLDPVLAQAGRRRSIRRRRSHRLDEVFRVQNFRSQKSELMIYALLN
jgi:hypothetical protein